MAHRRVTTLFSPPAAARDGRAASLPLFLCEDAAAAVYVVLGEGAARQTLSALRTDGGGGFWRGAFFSTFLADASLALVTAGKHHAGYVTKLNAAVKDNADLAAKSLDDLVLSAEGGVYNNAAQIWNHTFYWKSLSPNGGGAPTGKVAEMITAQWGSFDDFKKEFSTVAGGHFGSGWAWLVEKDGKLAIVGTHDAGNPLRDGTGKPILTIDVWEHAYYIDYRNARPQYLEAIWNLMNWEFANANLA